MGQCCGCCEDFPERIPPPRRLGAVFSDLDGTLIHSQKKLEQLGYERVETTLLSEDETLEKKLKETIANVMNSPRTPASARTKRELDEEEAARLRKQREMAGMSVTFRHIESGTLIETVPVPPLADTFISLKTLRLVHELRSQHDVDFVCMTGARTSTFLERCNRPDALPLFDFGVCEGGGRIYAKKQLLEMNSNVVDLESTSSLVTGCDGNSSSSSGRGSDYYASDNSETNLVLDTEWLDRFVSSIGPWRYNEKRTEMILQEQDPELPPSATITSVGQLWDCYRALQSRRSCLDAKIDAVPHLDARAFISSFLVTLVPHEKYLRSKKNSANDNGSPVASSPATPPLSSTALVVDCATPANPLSASAAAAAAAAVPGDSNAVVEEPINADDIHLQLLIKEHYPLLCIHTNLNKAHIGPRGCSKSDVLEYLCGTLHLAVDVAGSPVTLRAMRSEREQMQKQHRVRAAAAEANRSKLEELSEEYEGKRMQAARLATDIEELNETSVSDDKKIADAKEKYRKQLEMESLPPVVQAAAKIDKSRDTLRKLKFFWHRDRDAAADEEDANADVNGSDENLDPSELPLPLLECVEAVKLIFHSTDEGNGHDDEDDFFTEDDNEEEAAAAAASQAPAPARSVHSLPAVGISRRERSKWKGTLGCFAALVRATDLVDEINSHFSPFDIPTSQQRQEIMQFVDSSGVFFAVDSEEMGRQEELQLRVKPSWEIEEEGRRQVLLAGSSEKNNSEKQLKKEDFKLAMIAPLVDWCRAVAMFCSAREQLQPRFDKIRDKAKDVRRRRRQSAKKGADRAVLQARVDELSAEMAKLRAEAKVLDLRAAQTMLRLSSLDEAIAKSVQQQDAGAKRAQAEALRKMRAATGRRQPLQPRFCAALFDDENDLEFARLCEIGYAPSVAHSAVDQFLDANAAARGVVADESGKQTTDAETAASKSSPLKSVKLHPEHQQQQQRQKQRNEVKTTAVYERCPIQGLLGTEYALQQLVDMASAADTALAEWEQSVREAEERAAKKCC